MKETLNDSLHAIDEDLASSWIDLSAKVRELSRKVAEKSSGTNLASEAQTLADQAEKLCGHVEKIHKDVGEFISNIETRMEPTSSLESKISIPDEAINKENLQIQREHHEAKNDFKDIIKALFMWKDDPTERVRTQQK